MLQHRNIRKFTWTSPDGKTHNQIGNILNDRRHHLYAFDVQLFRASDCDTNHYLVVAKVSERLALSKQTTHRFYVDEIIGIISVGFNVTDQLLIRFFLIRQILEKKWGIQ
jgi:hypothetical protein